MSRPTHTATVATDPPTRPASNLPAIVHVAVFTIRRDARRAEDALGDLCAEHALQLLDGVVLDWPTESTHPTRRPLHNLPRLAAVPESTWATLIEDLQPAGPRGLLPLPPTPFTPGRSGIVTFCTAHASEPVRAELERVGAAITSVAINPTWLTELRGPR